MTFAYDDLSPVCRSENLGKHYFGFWVKKGYVSKSLLVDNEEEAVRLHQTYMKKDKYAFISELDEFELLAKSSHYYFSYVRNIEGGR